MPSASFILLLTVIFIYLEKVTSSTTPHWMSNEYKFTCTSECSKHLKGETFNCMPASPHGLAAGRLIVRVLPNLDWRYYRIYEDRNTKDLCKSVLIADEFYRNGNKTICRPTMYEDNDLYYDGIRTRSSEAKRNTDDHLMEKLASFLEKITKSTEELQKQAMVIEESVDSQDKANVSSHKRKESADEGTKRLLSLVGSLSKNVIEVNGLINSAHVQDTNNNSKYPPKNYHQNPKDYNSDPQYPLKSYYQNPKDYNSDPQYPPKSYYQNPKDYNSGVHKPSHRYNDDRTDALCFWASKDVCQKRKMIFCVHNVCCWTQLDAELCDVSVSLDDDINRHRKNLFHIIQATEAH